MNNLKERIKVAKEIAQEAGKLLLEIFNQHHNLTITTKGVADIVTEADTKSEELIIKLIEKHFPNDLIISEEKNSDKEHSIISSNGFVWILDPLDGTRNFSIGNPNFVVSIGIKDTNDDLNGVIYYPILNKLYIAANKEATLNGSIIKISKNTDLDEAIVGFWDKREKDPDYNKVDVLNRLRGKVKVLRMFGASALEKAWVANGQLDLYVGNSSSLFGAIAGVALIRNAGGIALNLEGNEWIPGDVGIICGNEKLVRIAIKILAE